MALLRLFGDDDFVSRMEQMQREMNRLWSAAWSSSPMGSGVFPAMNIYDDGESFIARAELPGIKSEDIDISVAGKTLTISGNRTIEPVGESETYHRRERKSGEFRRAFDLPDLVDANKVMAHFSNGVLEVVLPRAEQAKMRKIKINTK